MSSAQFHMLPAKKTSKIFQPANQSKPITTMMTRKRNTLQRVKALQSLRTIIEEEMDSVNTEEEMDLPLLIDLKVERTYYTTTVK